jgi:thymidylate synthase
MVVRIPEDIHKQIRSKRHEPPCLTLLDTEIGRDAENNKLRFVLTGYWRSWDAYAALPANLAGLQMFSETFIKELNTKGREKHRARWEEVCTGKMIMHSKNCHIYERQLPLVEELLKAKKSSYGEKIQLEKKTC